MSTRTLIFITLSMIVVLSASFLQNLYFPPVPPRGDPVNSVAGLDADGADSANQVLKTEEQAVSATKSDEIGDLTGEDADQDQSAEADSDAGVSELAIDEKSSAGEALDPEDHKLYSIGSIAVDGKSRFLITFDPVNGTVRRVELNYRNKSGGFRYRDLEYRGGYLGELDCITTALGCRVRVVGHGTPAHIAGIQSDDIIRSIDGEPVTTAEDFKEVMSRTKVGQSISVEVYRGEEQAAVTASIELTDKPIEMIRPDPDFLEQGHLGKPSFRATLRVPTPLEEQWPELDEQMMDSVWSIEQLTDDSIVFSHTITSEDIQKREAELGRKLDVTGPFKVIRTYSLVPVADVAVHQEGDRDFHFNMELSVENLSDRAQELTCHLDGPAGLPTETWWFQNKIHGRNLAIGYAAGARDIIGSSAQEEFTFYGGPEIIANLQKSQPKYKWVLKPPAEGTDESQVVNYLSVDAQYFNVALMPASPSQPFTAYSVLADIADTDLPISEIPRNAKKKRLVDCTFRMFKNMEIGAGEKYIQSFEVFAGPKEPGILAAYGLQDVRIFGWFAMFSKPLCWLLTLFYKLTFQLGYGIPIILLTVLVRSLMIPISRKAALNAQMMQYLQPQMKELADKYKDDMEKRGQAQRDLFKKYKYNPFGGCFMMFLQIPIFIGLYRGLSVDVALRDQPLIHGLSWCSNLAAPDQFWYWKDTLPSFLGFLTDETGWLGPYLNILPIITCFLFIAQQKLFTPPPTDEQQEMMQKVMKYMMVFMGVLFFKVPSGLCLYFITSSLWGIAERKMLPKPEIDKSRLDEISDDAPDKAAIKKLKKKKVELEIADRKRQEELDEKRRRDRERKKKLKKRGA